MGRFLSVRIFTLISKNHLTVSPVQDSPYADFVVNFMSYIYLERK
jgi:hypothetical protein